MSKDEPGKTGLTFKRYGKRHTITLRQENSIRSTYKELETISGTAKALRYSDDLVKGVIDFFDERLPSRRNINKRVGEAARRRDPSLSDLDIHYYDRETQTTMYLTKTLERKIIKTESEKEDEEETYKILDVPKDLVSKVLKYHSQS